MARSRERAPWFEQVGFASEEPFSPEDNTSRGATSRGAGLSGASAWLAPVCLAGIPVVCAFALTIGGDLPLPVGTAEILGYCTIGAGISLTAPARWARKRSGPSSRLYWWIGSGAVSIPLFGFFFGVAVATGYYLKWPRPLYWWTVSALAALLLAAGILWGVWFTVGPEKHW